MTNACGSAPEKPKAAVLNQQAALVNIQTKISVIEKWITSGVPEIVDNSGEPVSLPNGKRKLDFYPTSLRQFNFWESSRQCTVVMATLPPFGRNANDTLRRYPSLRNQVISLLNELAKSIKRVSKTSEQSVSSLHRELAVTNARRLMVEAQFSDQRRQIRDLEKTVKELEKQMIASVEEAVKINVRLQAEVAALHSEKAELTKAMMNIIPFSAVT